MVRSNKTNMEAVSAAAPVDERVRILKLLLETRGYSKSAIERTANEVNSSVERLRHLFKQQTRVSMSKYARNVRLEKAKHLLETTYDRIQEIEVKCGFKDSKRLARDFKAAYGLTPKRYRAQYLAEQAAGKARGEPEQLADARRGPEQPADPSPLACATATSGRVIRKSAGR